MMKTIKLSELNKEKIMIWLENPTKYNLFERVRICVALKKFKPVKGS